MSQKSSRIEEGFVSLVFLADAVVHCGQRGVAEEAGAFGTL